MLEAKSTHFAKIKKEKTSIWKKEIDLPSGKQTQQVKNLKVGELCFEQDYMFRLQVHVYYCLRAEIRVISEVRKKTTEMLKPKNMPIKSILRHSTTIRFNLVYDSKA